MHVTSGSAHAVAAADLHRDVVVVPRQMLVRQAAGLIHRARASAAAVVDEQGRCIGMLSAADVFRWIADGCPEVVLRPAAACPYQVHGRLLTGGEAVICILAHGSCPYQTPYPGLGGRSTGVCMRPENADSPVGTVPSYMTTDLVTVRPETPLPELLRRINDSPADCAFVVDESARPIGVVSAKDVLIAVGRELTAEL